MSNTTTLIDRADGPDGATANTGIGVNTPSISADGRSVAFDTNASNLSPEAPDNTHSNAFVRDLQSHADHKPGQPRRGRRSQGQSPLA